MKELLFEVYCEEIPAMLQEYGAKQLLLLQQKRLKEKLSIDYQGKYFYTPRRIGFMLKNLPDQIISEKGDIRGPRVNANEAAITGFKRKYRDCKYEQRDGYIYSNSNSISLSIEQFITNSLNEILASFIWPKSMRWGQQDIKWVRPIHSILCILDGVVLPIEMGSITASNITRGNWLIEQDRLEIKSFEDYQEKLRNKNVLICPDERKKVIKLSLESLLESNNITMINDNNLLKEVSNLVEYPFIALGAIEQRFMKLPKEVLINTLRTHQKYLMTQNKDGDLAPFFVIVSGIMGNGLLKEVIKGNEKVLQARLSDAEFFFLQDKKTTLFEKSKGLKRVTYHAKIGSYQNKVDEIQEVALKLSFKMGVLDEDVVRSASLIKADLMTQMVNEQPDLQGIMGYYYALYDGEKNNISCAIKDHYLPQGPKDHVPRKPLSVIMALADKFVTLSSMFRIGIIVSGSKDPYALRRAAIGVIRIICSNHIDIQLRDFLREDIVQFIQDRLKSFDPIKNGLTANDMLCMK